MATKVLIIDRDEVLAQSLRDALPSHTHWEFNNARGVAEGLRRIREIKPDIVLLDGNFGGSFKESLDFLWLLRTSPELRDLPVLILSEAPAMAGELLDGLGLGAKNFQAKPVGAEVILARVEMILASLERSKTWPAQLTDLERMSADDKKRCQEQLLDQYRRLTRRGL